MSFTLRNLKEDLEDVGSRFDGAPDLEFRLATEALRAEKSGLSYRRRPARLSLSVRPHAQEARGGVRGPARERAAEGQRRDRRAQGMGRGARPARYVARLRGRAGASRSSSSARPISARLSANVDGQRDWWADW